MTQDCRKKKPRFFSPLFFTKMKKNPPKSSLTKIEKRIKPFVSFQRGCEGDLQLPHQLCSETLDLNGTGCFDLQSLLGSFTRTGGLAR